MSAPFDLRPAGAQMKAFRLRSAAAAARVARGEVALIEVVDVLQQHAMAFGLVAALGQDAVQTVIAEALERSRAEPMPATNGDNYEGLSSSFAALCRKADAEHCARKRPDETLTRLRRLLVSDVSLDTAYQALNERTGAAGSTLAAAEHLIQENDPERLRRWLAKHTAQERAAILDHLEQKERRS